MKVKPFDDGTYVGCTVTGTMTATDITVQSGRPHSVADPSTDVFRGHKENGPIGITFDNEIIRFHLDRSALFDFVPGVNSSGVGDMAGIGDFKVSVTFPGTVLSHSGSSKVDGDTVTWTDVSDLLSPDGLTASGKSQGGLPGWVWGIGALVTLASGGAVAAMIINRRWWARPRDGGAAPGS